MHKDDKAYAEAEASAWGLWERQGRTTPNRLGFRRVQGFVPVKWEKGKYNRIAKAQAFHHWECSECHTIVHGKKPVVCQRCEGRHFYPLIQEQSGRQDRNSTTKSTVPESFTDDARERRVAHAVDRMDPFCRLVMREKYVKLRSLNEIAALYSENATNIKRIHSEALAFLLGAITTGRPAALDTA